jgi:hypothetical protein
MLGWIFNNNVTCEMTAEERFRVVLNRLDEIERKIDYIVRALGGGGDGGVAAEEREDAEAGEADVGDEGDEGSDSDTDSVESSKTA